METILHEQLISDFYWKKFETLSVERNRDLLSL